MKIKFKIKTVRLQLSIFQYLHFTMHLRGNLATKIDKITIGI